MIVRWAAAVLLAFAASQYVNPGVPILPAGFDSAQVAFGVAFGLAAITVAARSRGYTVVGAVSVALYAALRLPPPPLSARGAVLDWALLAVAVAVAVLLPWLGRPGRAEVPADVQRPRGRTLAIATAVSLAAAVGSLGWLAATNRGPQAAVSVAWSDFGPGLERSATLGRPMLVDFFAEWCQPCKVMDRVTFADPRVAAKLQSAVVPVRVDAEGTASVAGHVGVDLAERYGVESYPTVVLIDAQGRELARSRGVKRPGEFVAWLDAALARGSNP